MILFIRNIIIIEYIHTYTQECLFLYKIYINKKVVTLNSTSLNIYINI